MNEMTHEINSNQSHPLDQYIEDNTNTNPTVAQDFNLNLVMRTRKNRNN